MIFRLSALLIITSISASCGAFWGGFVSLFFMWPAMPTFIITSIVSALALSLIAGGYRDERSETD